MEKGKLEDKVTIITGATSGMGKAIAISFYENGAKLILSGRDRERGNALEKELPGSVFIPGDVGSVDYNHGLIQKALHTFGKLDILSLNAGILGLGNVVDLPVTEWKKTLDVNLNSIFYISKYAIPHLQQNLGGTILINSSIAAFKSFPNHPAYCASKGATLALMRQMAVDHAPNVRVNAICPGPVDTPLIWNSAKAFKDPEKAVGNAARATLLNRLGTPQDVAKLALFLVSEDASWITGTAMTIDGGTLNV